MSRRRSALLALALALLALCGLWPAVQRPQPPPVSAERAPPAQRAAASSAIVARTAPQMPARVKALAGVGASAMSEPAPAVDAPQIDHIRYWRARARSGDPYALCRYAREAQHCAALVMNTADWMRERFVAEMVTRGDFGEIPDCRGVSLQDVLPQFDQLLRAASGGHRPSQLLFAAGGGFALAEGVRFPQRLHQFRDHAPMLAWRAFDGGDPDAVVLLWRAYHGIDRDQSFLAGAIDPDPVIAHALDLLMHDLDRKHVVGDARELGLNATDTRKAHALHDAWRAQAFAHPRAPRHGLRIEESFDWDDRAVDLCADDAAQ